jgi:hypothetical protein
MTNYALEKHLHQLEKEMKRLRRETTRLKEISKAEKNYWKSFQRQTRRGLRTPQPGESTFNKYYNSLSKSLNNTRRVITTLESLKSLRPHINKTRNALLRKYHVPRGRSLFSTGMKGRVNKEKVTRSIVKNAKKSIRKTGAEYELLKEFHPSIVKGIMNRMN